MIYQRILTLGVNDAPVWCRLYVTRIGPRWAASILTDQEQDCEGMLSGLGLIGASAEDARDAAIRYFQHAGLLSCPRCGSLQAVALSPRRSRSAAGRSGGGPAREFICKECGESWTSCHGAR